MASRSQSITPFKSGQQSNVHGKAENVKVVANASQSLSADPATGVDHLTAALSTRGMPLLPSDTHKWTHTTTVEPVGAHYSPAGEFGHVMARQAVPPTSMNLHTSRPGDNALGKALNKVGQKSGYPKSGKKSGGGGRRA